MRNRSRPEGSIAEGYIAEECLVFCSRYFEGVETKSNRPSRNEGSLGIEDPYNIFSGTGRPLGKCEMVRLNIIELEQVHRYVLFHYDGIVEYRKYVLPSGFLSIVLQYICTVECQLNITFLIYFEASTAMKSKVI